jgi:hypothetical protein
MRFKIEIQAERPDVSGRDGSQRAIGKAPAPGVQAREIEVANVEELADYFADELLDKAGRPLRVGAEARVTRLAYRGRPFSRRPWG